MYPGSLKFPNILAYRPVDHARAVRKAAAFVAVCMLSVLSAMTYNFYVGVRRVLCWPVVNPVRQRGLMMSFFSRLTMRAVGLEVHVSSAVPKGDQNATYLILANHMSYLDVVAIASVIPTCFLAKSEIGQWPLIGAITRFLGGIFVTRESMKSRLETIRAIRKTLKHGNVTLFPEGTTTASRVPRMDPWYAGHLYAVDPQQTKVVLVGISYEHHEAMVWVDDMDFLSHFWSFCQRKRTSVFLSLQLASCHALSPAGFRLQSRLYHQKISEMCLRDCK